MPDRFFVRLRLLALVAAAALLATLAPQPARAISTMPEWQAWHMKVTFPDRSPLPRRPKIVLTQYTGYGDPAVVTGWSQTDISANCVIVGNLTYDTDGYAVFNGSSYIRCPMPPKPPGVVACEVGPFWVAADMRLPAQNTNNPIFEGVEAGVRTFSFSTPRNGSNARTLLELGGATYLTAPWTAGVGAVKKRVMFGANGPTNVDVVEYFATQGINWLGFMNGWEASYDPNVTGKAFRHLAQTPSQTWDTQHGLLTVHPQYVYIGHSPTTGTYFQGGLRDGEIDPPGCYGG
jgi:hypothetical protein